MARHVSTVPMRWSDVDAYQHVNNVAFLDYLQEARVDMLFLHAERRGTERLVEGVVVASHVVDYVAPLHPRPAPVRIETWVAGMSNASFTLGYEVVDDGADGAREVYVRAQSVLVPFDLSTERPRRLSDAERALLGSHLEAEGPAPRRPVPVPDPAPEAVHVHRCRVRWGDLDAYRHVNNATMLEYFQDARVDLARDLLPTLEPHEGSVVAAQSIRYRKPVPFRSDPVDVVVRLLRRSQVAYTVGYEVRDGEAVFADGQSTQVAFDLASGRPRRWSTAEQDALDRLVG